MPRTFPRRRTALDSQSPRSAAGGGEGSRPDSSRNFFPARLGAKGAGSSPGVGRWNSGSGANSAQWWGDVRALVVWRRTGGFSVRMGLGSSLPPPPQRQRPRSVGAGVRGPLPRAHAARSPPTWPPRPAPCARHARRANPTHRALVAGRTDGLGRDARPPGCFEALGWDCALSLLPRRGAEPPPRVPSFPDPASRGVMSGAGRAEGEGRRQAGGGRWRERPQPRERPRSPLAASPLSSRQVWGGVCRGVGERGRKAPLLGARSLSPAPSLTGFHSLPSLVPRLPLSSLPFLPVRVKK